MTLGELRNSETIILDCISGSHAYGLATETSDVDRKGVFCLPESKLLGLNSIEQIADERNDEVYYELGRFVDLASKNNPNILELLATPTEHIKLRHEVFDLYLPPSLFLSQRCEITFGRYAIAQIKKARGLNKKVVNPMPRERKTILDFCFVLVGSGSLPIKNWLADNDLDQSQCGLVSVPHAKDVYALYTDGSGGVNYSGIVGKKDSNTVRVSSIPKGEVVSRYMVFHADGYSQHCRAHREYWDWVEKRNDHRYASTLNHGGGYDAKNMMHTFRLLEMAIEILRDGTLQVERPNRDELLAIKRGEFSYDQLLTKADELLIKVELAGEKSKLPEQPDMVKIDKALVETRQALYLHAS